MNLAASFCRSNFAGRSTSMKKILLRSLLMKAVSCSRSMSRPVSSAAAPMGSSLLTAKMSAAIVSKSSVNNRNQKRKRLFPFGSGRFLSFCRNFSSAAGLAPPPQAESPACTGCFPLLFPEKFCGFVKQNAGPRFGAGKQNSQRNRDNFPFLEEFRIAEFPACTGHFPYMR